MTIQDPEKTLGAITQELRALRSLIEQTETERKRDSEEAKDRWRRLEPVLDQRSGELERMNVLRRDHEHLRMKVDKSNERIEVLDRRVLRLRAWMAGAGAIGAGAGQIILWLAARLFHAG